MNSARLLGIVLVVAGVAAAVVGGAWLRAGLAEGATRQSGALLGAFFLALIVVLPLVGFGLYFLLRGNREAREQAAVAGQRKLLDIVATRGQVAIPDLVLEMNSSRDQVEADLLALVGRGLFSGYVDWNKGMLYSVEASKLQGRQTCPNCGGKLELAGKGLIKCPYCGAEIFLQG
jgi:DNA-directed RNA polymerase subunit RPC12/RpoP